MEDSVKEETKETLEKRIKELEVQLELLQKNQMDLEARLKYQMNRADSFRGGLIALAKDLT